jgi:hypothetical protein
MQVAELLYFGYVRREDRHLPLSRVKRRERFDIQPPWFILYFRYTEEGSLSRFGRTYRCNVK